MNEIIQNYFLFLAKTLTILISILVLFASKLAFGENKKSKHTLSIESLSNKHNLDLSLLMKAIDPKKAKKHAKELKKELNSNQSRLFVIDFDGDMLATEVEGLRRIIDCLIPLTNKKDQVLIRLESKGGSVPHYGLAAVQLSRLRQANIPLIVCVDKIAASGGYLMAACANKILANPFSIIGSVGVVMNMPNIHKLLKKNNIDFHQITAGKYKRTLTPYTAATKEASNKVQKDVDMIHYQFKHFISKYRPNLNIESIATGEHWIGSDALELGLIDDLECSDDLILNFKKTHSIYHLQCKKSKSMLEKLGLPVSQLFNKSQEWLNLN